MAVCLITGTLLGVDGDGIVGATVRARTINGVINGTNLVVPKEVSTSTDVNGLFTMNVVQSLSVVFIVDYPPNEIEPRRSISYTGTIPATASANFVSVITLEG